VGARGKIDARYIGGGRSVWRVKPRILLEMTTLRRTLQTRKTDNQELYPSKLSQMIVEPICRIYCRQAQRSLVNGLALADLQAENQELTLPRTGLRRMNQVVLKLDTRLAGEKHRESLRYGVVGRGCDGRAMHVWEMKLEEGCDAMISRYGYGGMIISIR
jgi:hypothetical protein